jgi:hypothetical protein
MSPNNIGQLQINLNNEHSPLRESNMNITEDAIVVRLDY